MEKTEAGRMAEKVATITDEKVLVRIQKVLNAYDLKREEKALRISEKVAIKETKKAIKERILADMENEKKAILESFKARKREMLNTALKSVSSTMKK